ncbi:MAG TPA: hypothetical protein VK436_00050 [Methanocella sp.]|nr:hypothetical protein [Methanocella sp.]
MLGKSSVSVSNIVDKFYTLLRVRSDELRRQRVDLGAMASTIIERFKAESPGSKVRVHTPQSLFVHADPDMMYTALYYLLKNSWDNVRDLEPGVIIFTMDLQAMPSMYIVKDNRSDHDKSSINYSLNIEKVSEHGLTPSGIDLGLTIAKSIVNRHGGNMWAEYTGAWLYILFTI